MVWQGELLESLKNDRVSEVARRARLLPVKEGNVRAMNKRMPKALSTQRELYLVRVGKEWLTRSLTAILTTIRDRERQL
jgi:hypothetical protein